MWRLKIYFIDFDIKLIYNNYMSANNQILIKKTKQGYVVKDICVEGGMGNEIFVAQNLETAIKKSE